VTNSAQNGFSQSASAQPPQGTWENGVFDYDHLKKSYLPTYTRHWDDQSKVPFLYSLSTGIWISYDDLQSIRIKSDYIKREKLAGAMFWELSSDRNYELITSTYEVLNNEMKPSNESKPPKETSSSVVKTKPAASPKISLTKISNDDYPIWEINKDYKIGDQVMFEKKMYRCTLPHKSLPGWTPYVVGALWQAI
jgi:hypothetical protein